MWTLDMDECISLLAMTTPVGPPHHTQRCVDGIGEWVLEGTVAAGGMGVVGVWLQPRPHAVRVSLLVMVFSPP